MKFAISSPSRHPSFFRSVHAHDYSDQNGYDSEKRRYRPEYVKPASWDLGLHLPADAEQQAAERPESFKFFLWEVNGSFSFTVPSSPYPPPIRRTGDGLLVRDQRPAITVQVPHPGEYEITLSVRWRDGGVETSTRRYTLRDLLVVGIGDSFASGQGNPDVPAVPAPDQQVMCKATSLALLASKVDEAVSAFIEDVTRYGREKVSEYLPYIGKIVVGYVNGVESLVDSITNRVESTLTGLVRDGASAVQEGLEEAASWIGIGDGGEAAELVPHPAKWQEPLAYRSYRSGQSLAASLVERDLPDGADRVTFVGLGRSGAEIDDGILGPRTSDSPVGGNVSIDGWTGHRGQLEEAEDTVAGRHVDVLIISIGLNDLGFSALVKNSILFASGQKRKQRIAGAARRIAEDLPANFSRLKSAIDTGLRPDLVLLTGYPVGIFKEIAEGTKEPCGVLASSIPFNVAANEGLNLDGPDARDMGALGVQLNEMLREQADAWGWIYVDGIEQASDGHGYCSDDPYFVSAEESCLNQGDFEGMLHPNSKGHKVTSEAIARTMRAHLGLRAVWLEPVLLVVMS